jgi:hypothetical protein
MNSEDERNQIFNTFGNRTWDEDLYPKYKPKKEEEKSDDKFLSDIVIEALKYDNKPDPRSERILHAMNEEGYSLDSGTIQILFDLILKQQKQIEDLRQAVRFINGALNSM